MTPTAPTFRSRLLPRVKLRLSMYGLLAACLVFLADQTRAEGLPTALHDETFVAGEAMIIDAVIDSTSGLNGGFAIDSAGYADLPILGRVMVAGQTRETVQQVLSEKLANYLKDTHVNAIPAVRLTFLGHWTKPGQYYVSPKSTLFEAARSAGGIAGERNLGKITVRRGSDITDINFLDNYSKGVSVKGAGIRSGDLFVIPVPRDNVGFWYWFREGLGATAQVATVVSTVLTLYITYHFLDERQTTQTSIPTTTP
jgi:Polysaccharide biosynthesis/export protein